MTDMNSTAVVREQYKTAQHLNTRISIHSKYSINKQGFGNWIVSHYDIKPGAEVLELGCGTGDMWKDHLDVLDRASAAVLTDFSAGMLNTAKANIGERQNVEFRVADIQSIPYDGGRFDVVIANMMLYHVPDIHRGLNEVHRVMKEGGMFYCATYGEYGIVQRVTDLLHDYGVKDNVNKNFTLQNGTGLLKAFFSSVDRFDYQDSLAVTEIDDLIDYLYSLSSMTSIREIDRDVLRRVLKQNCENGVLRLPKEYGMFVCRK